MTGRVVVRIIGGLGNQLFAYAAARRLALANDAELVLDTRSGFAHDQYGRAYQLDAFQIAGREASAAERLQPFGRQRRAVLRGISAMLPYQRRPYIRQGNLDFDPRLLSRKVRGLVRLEGYWTSEGYFLDIADTIRADLELKAPPGDALNLETSASIARTPSVGLHVRWFGDPGVKSGLNVSPDYYRRAIAEMEARVPGAHFFVFSDNPEAARTQLPLTPGNSTFVTHNDSSDGAVADLWLLRQCRHFIIANSTFSWWGAWLGADPDKIVLCPSPETVSAPSWTMKGLLPSEWVQI